MDDGSFDAWYRELHPRVLATMFAVYSNRDAARDATDESFARAFADWRRVAAMESPDGWVYRVAVNTLKRAMRRRAVESEITPASYVSATEMPSYLPEVMAAVRALPVRQRTAISLRVFADLPEQQIADAMGISRGAVSSTLHAARNRLAVQLSSLSPTEVPHARNA